MVIDHGNLTVMQTMAISKFKATCLAVLERVRRTGQPLRITRFGKPVADIVPPAPEPKRRSWLGSMRGTAKIKGDIKTRSVIVDGTVNGNITAGERCELRAGCTVNGDIEAPRLVVDEAASFIGSAKIATQKQSPASA